MIAGLLIGFFALLSVSLIKLAHGKDTKPKIPFVLLLTVLLLFWSLAMFFLLLGMAEEDFLLSLIIAITVPLGISLWIILARRHRKANALAESETPSSVEETISLDEQTITNEVEIIPETIIENPTIESNDNTTVDFCNDLDADNTTPNVEDNFQTKICYHCGKEISGNGKFCRYCGKNLEQQTKFCRKCGEKLFIDSAYCEHCGTKISTTTMFRRK